MALFYKRNTDIYISKNPNASADATNTVQLNVKDFSYNKISNSVEVGRETLDPLQERTTDPHVVSVSPINFSFTTYILPLVDTNVTSPEEFLWVSLMGADSLTSNPTSSTIDFSDGNVSELRNLTLWFNQTTQTEGNYRIDNAVVDSATISFDINRLAEIIWQGRALSIVEDNTTPAFTDRTGVVNCLLNKLSTISLTVNAISFTLALKGGSINFDNRNTYYGRSKVGEIIIPVGHYTGNRRISGNIEVYLKSGSNESVDLFNEILNNITNNNYEATHLANITITVAGASPPNLQLNVPQALLNLGQQTFGELYSMSIPFVAKEETGSYSTVIYNMP